MAAPDNKGVPANEDKEKDFVLNICDDQFQNEDVGEVLYGTARKTRICADMKTKLSHYPEKEANKTTNTFVDGDVLACLLNQLKLADGLV